MHCQMPPAVKTATSLILSVALSTEAFQLEQPYILSLFSRAK
jgi:hypothetical protein